MQDWKKSSPQDCVSPRGHFAPRLFLLSSSFSKINSSAKIRMALKRHTVLYRLTLRRPLRRKLWMRWFFDVSKVKESSFLKSNLTYPLPSDFWCASFGNYRFKPFQISFFSGFYIKIIFWVRWFIAYSNEWNWRAKGRFLFALTNLYLHHFI